jgi:hypothetical protein
LELAAVGAARVELLPSKANRNGIAGFPFAGNIAVAKAGFVFPGVDGLLNLDAEASANGG